MKIFPECYACFEKQANEVAKILNADERLKNIVLKIAKEMINEHADEPAPVIAAKFQRRVREMVKEDDPYLKVKQESNIRAINLVPKLETIIKNSDWPFATACRISIAGNSIDFGVRSAEELTNWEDELLSLININKPENDVIKAFEQSVASAKKILFLADNTGEIVFDKLFLKHLPLDKLTVAVRGNPILNDATMADAKFIGLTNIVKVIDNGSDVPGTWLPFTSKEFQDEYNSSDLIISKGQGNFETLYETNKNIYFLFRIKCVGVSKIANKKLGELVIVENQ